MCTLLNLISIYPCVKGFKGTYIHTLNVCSRGTQFLFCFPESLNVSRDEVEGNIEIRGKTKLTIFPEGTDIKRFVI
jgi:hypothetical protein